MPNILNNSRFQRVFIFCTKLELLAKSVFITPVKFELFCFCYFDTGAHLAAAYNELIGKIELFNKCLCFGMSITVGLLFLPFAAFSFFQYYISNMGEDSFHLFFPAWFVCDQGGHSMIQQCDWTIKNIVFVQVDQPHCGDRLNVFHCFFCYNVMSQNAD